MKECCQCGQWKIKNTDDYCGYCGFLQLDISVEPRELALISEIVTDGKIVFRNNGIKDIEVEILPMEPAFEGLSFLPSNSFTLFKENSFEIKVLLDENKISDDMMVEKKKYICLIDKDKRKTIDLFIVLKGGPKAASLINEIRFGDVEEGKDAESWTEIINKGGIPLQIKDISLEGSDQFQIGLKEPLEQLDPGQKKKIPVIWKSPKFDPVLNTNKVGLRVQFKNSAKDLFIPIKGKLFKFQFGIEPAEIKINEALSKQAYSRKVTLTNNGTKDIEVMAIETDVEWIQIISKAANFTLLCRDSVTRNVAIGPTVYAESYTFEVVCFPKELNEGVQKAKVKVKTTKDDIFAEIDIQLYVIRPKECFDFIGIDFGTTNSVVAIWNDYEGDICLVEDENPYTKKRTPLIPSVLVFHGRPDNYKIGTEAEREAEVFADVSVRSIKRIMGYGNDRVFFEKKFSPEDLAALIIKKLIEYAEERLYNINKSRGGAYLNIRKAIVTVPANFYDLQIRGILSACEKAGLDIDHEFTKETSKKLKEAVGHDINAGIILDEPSAAALFFLSKLQEEGKFEKEFAEKFEKNQDINFLIFDYGGGTLDVSVVQLIKLSEMDIGIKVLANKGDNQIGGDTIDITIMNELLKKCKEKEKFVDFDDSLISSNFNDLEKRRQNENWDKYESSQGSIWAEVLRARGNWKKAVENLKLAMDTKKEVEFKINQGGTDIFSIADGKVKYNQNMFIEKIFRDLAIGWMEPILKKCKDLVIEALSFAEIEQKNIDYVIHTGRSSLMPKIQEDIRSLFPHLHDERIIFDPDNLKVCVAKGAALYGAMRTGILTDNRVRLVSGGRRLPHGYGVQVFKGLKPIFEPIIKIGTEYPTEQTKSYEEIPGQRHLTLKFLQNSGMDNNIRGNRDIRQIGSITVDTLADGKPGCNVKFMIDANRKMEVSADGKNVDIDPIRYEDEDRWVG